MAPGECGALRREGSLHLLEEPCSRERASQTPLRPKRRLDLEPRFPRPLGPLAPQLVAADALALGLAGGQGRHLRGLRRAGAADLELGLNLGAAAGEGTQRFVGDAGDLGGAAANLKEGEPELGGELVAKLGLVEVAGALRVAI